MVDEKTFNGKYYYVPDIFKDWMPKDFDFGRSTILDFGCEQGIMALSFAFRMKVKKVIGVDINSLNTQLSEIAKERLHIDNLPANLEFRLIRPGEKLSPSLKFDAIFSWSTFEHVDQSLLDEVVTDLRSSLSKNGFMFVQIAPLYYSAFGSHLENLVKEPWAHLKMQNDSLLNKLPLIEPLS